MLLVHRIGALEHAYVYIHNLQSYITMLIEKN